MTPFVTFSGYGANSREVTVAAARVTHLYPILYNGNPGTCICLDTGKEINVGDWSTVVEKRLAEALQP